MPSTFRQTPNVILTEVDDQRGVLLHLDTKFYYTLNATGVALWKVLESDSTPALLSEALVRQFRVDPATATVDVAAILEELVAEGLASERRE